ncbi:hypothetical protein L3Q82_010672 [Scomber scombrus]|uniref:Uncharacterized protein n=1 Tax=Scomber scombrus TaxID=13677 RepID=A0AAV1NWV4_SCOSC
MEHFNEGNIKMFFYENRLKTFEGWPFDADCACTPQNMAKAGFIHTPSENSPDIAMCFFCLKELEGWEPEDDPEKEHKSHSPSCHFITLKKKVEELTVEEFVKLQKERQKFITNKACKEAITKFEEAAKLRRGEIIKTGMAGICGTLSFAFLAASLGTEYWYIIEMNPVNMSDLEDISSHSGLWSINEGGKMYADSIDSFTADYSRYSETELRMLNMHSAIVVVLPLSLVLLLFGGICGLVSSLARSPVLLTGTASYFFVCSLLTLCGVSLYIIYSYLALAETERLVGPEGLAYIHTSFGWSLGLAWLSYSLELLSGILLLIAARMAKLQHSSPTMA